MVPEDKTLEDLRKEFAKVEKNVQHELDKAVLSVEDSIERFEKELKVHLGEYHLDSVQVTLKFTEKILGTGTEQDVALTFMRSADKGGGKQTSPKP